MALAEIGGRGFSTSSDGLEVDLKRRLSKETDEREKCHVALQRLTRSADFCIQRLASSSEPNKQGAGGSGRIAVQRIFDLLQPLEKDLTEATRLSESCSATAADLVAVGSYDVLRQSLQVTQRRCEELSGSMLRQTEANAEMEGTLATAKAANRRLLEQLRAQTDGLDRLRSRQAADSERLAELRHRAAIENDVAEREQRIREEGAVQAVIDQESQKTKVLAERFEKVKKGLKTANEAVKALKPCVDRSAYLDPARREAEAQLQAMEQEILGKIEAALKKQSCTKSSVESAVRELDAQVEHEVQRRQQENLRVAQQHAVLSAECQHLQARSAREAEVLSSQLQETHRVIAAERSLAIQEQAKRERQVDVAEAQLQDLENSAERARREIDRLETMQDQSKAELQNQALSLNSLTRQVRDSSDAVSAAQGGNEHLKVQMEEQRRRVESILHEAVGERRLLHERQLAEARAAGEATILDLQHRALQVESESKARSTEIESRKSPLSNADQELEDLRSKISGLREALQEALTSRATLEESMAKERQKFNEEKIRLKTSLGKLTPQVEKLEEKIQATSADLVTRSDEVKALVSKAESKLKALEEELRASKAEHADAKRKLAAESDTFDRVSIDLEQHSQRALQAQEVMASELQRRRAETSRELQALEEQLSAERMEADACQAQLDLMRSTTPAEESHPLERSQQDQSELLRLQQEAKRQRERHTSLRQDLGRVRRLLDESRANMDWVRREQTREGRSASRLRSPSKAILSSPARLHMHEAEAVERLLKNAEAEHEAKLKAADAEHKRALAGHRARLDAVTAENDRLRRTMPARSSFDQSPLRPRVRSPTRVTLSPARTSVLPMASPDRFTSPLRSLVREPRVSPLQEPRTAVAA